MNGNDPDNLYMNIRINRGGDQPDPRNFTNIASYEITQNNPIINDPSQYYLAITDFTIPLTSIPINVVRIIPNQPNPNLMTSCVSISYLGITYTENLIYIPSTNILPPVQDKPYQVITNYYFAYSYNFILESFNVALAAVTLAAGIPIAPGKEYPRFILVDGDFQKIKLIVPDDFINSGAVIAFNDPALNYLGGFDMYYNITNPPTSRHEIIFLSQVICNEYGIYDPTGDYFYFEQQYYALPQWNSLSKIIIYTNSIPIRNQQSTGTNILAPDLLSTLPILFSDIVDYNTISQAKNFAFLQNEPQYRLIDLVSHTPLKRIQLTIGWMDHFGEVFPLYLQPYQSCCLQLGFFKKDLYKSIK